jgi:hypothetical protein
VSTRLVRETRVVHCNEHRSYGRGIIVEIVRPLVREACKAYVRFDGEASNRLVWLDDLSPEPCRPATLERPSLAVVPQSVA